MIEKLGCYGRVFKHLYPEPKEVVGWRGDTILIDWAYVLNECFDMSRMHRFPNDFVVATDVLNKRLNKGEYYGDK